MTYTVREIFYTLQGEGVRAGRPAVFCRFSGCNLWTGREEDRIDAVCKFCDTDFVGTSGTLGGKYIFALDLAQKIESLWPHESESRYVVLTGGEPLLQVDAELLDALHKLRFEIAIETNGTIVAPTGIDWICVSPKAGAPWVQRKGDEIKLIYPQPSLMPEDLGLMKFENFLLQPMDGPDQARNTKAAIDFCLANPRWRLSIQSHKILQIR